MTDETEAAPRSLLRPHGRRIVGEVREGLELARFLLGAHHPLCDRFRSDVFLIRHVPVCRGCFFVLPLLILSFPLSFFALRHAPEAWAASAPLALLLGVPQATTYLKRWGAACVRSRRSWAASGSGCCWQ